jgi:hypothetical protein
VYFGIRDSTGDNAVYINTSSGVVGWAFPSVVSNKTVDAVQTSKSSASLSTFIDNWGWNLIEFYVDDTSFSVSINGTPVATQATAASDTGTLADGWQSPTLWDCVVPFTEITGSGSYTHAASIMIRDITMFQTGKSN